MSSGTGVPSTARFALSTDSSATPGGGGPARERLEENRADGVEVAGRRRLSPREDFRSDVGRERLSRPRYSSAGRRPAPRPWPKTRASPSFEMHTKGGTRKPCAAPVKRSTGAPASSAVSSRSAMRRPCSTGKRRAEEARGEELVERAALDVRVPRNGTSSMTPITVPFAIGGPLDVVDEMDGRLHRGEERGRSIAADVNVRTRRNGFSRGAPAVPARHTSPSASVPRARVRTYGPNGRGLGADALMSFPEAGD